MGKKVLILVLLALFAVQWFLDPNTRSGGLDFYQMWSIPTAAKLSAEPLGSPYVEGDAYFEVLNRHADDSRDPKLVGVNRRRRSLDLTTSPLTLVCFHLCSKDYSTSLAVYQVLLLLAFLSGVLLLGFLHRGDVVLTLFLAVLLVVCFQPFASDLRVGNMNSFQLLLLAGALVLAHRIPKAGTAVLKMEQGIVFLSILALVTLLKPSMILVTVLLAAHLWAKNGAKTFFLSALPASLVAVLLLLLPCVFFGSWGIWGDWLGYLHGSGERLSYPVEYGNFSTTAILSGWFGSSLRWTVVGLAVASWVAAVGFTATAALSPLFWYHYYVFALIPGLWLVLRAERSGGIAAAGVAGLVMGSGVFAPVLILLGWHQVLFVTVTFCWIPLWLGTLAMKPEVDVAAPVEEAPLTVFQQREAEAAGGSE
ncbi:MAG: hypothetical protein ACYTAF_09040 [Planctomycetota bacterium]|jgi:hypothetical protein